MTEPAKPLPCPFCGIGGSVWYIEDDSKTPHEFFVECAVCKATGQRTGLKETAIVGWNRRRFPDPRIAHSEAKHDALATTSKAVIAGLEAQLRDLKLELKMKENV